jgi:thiol:disulfide interchange protein DsbD
MRSLIAAGSRRFLAPLLALCALATTELSARVPENLVRVELVADVAAVRPGDRVRLGLVQKITPGWHTYWVNPGDSGLPTTVAFAPLAGVEIGPIVWPLPSRLPVGPMVNFGYKDEVLLPMTLNVAETVAPGAVTLTAEAEWLVCADVCIPESATVALTLPVLPPGAPVVPSAAAAGFANAGLPMPAPWSATHARVGQRITIDVASEGLSAERLVDVFFFPLDANSVRHAAPQAWRVADGRLAIDLVAGDFPPPPGAPLDGVLRVAERIEGGREVSHGFLLSAPPGAIAPAPPAIGGLGWALLLALAGGLILNLMPCVLPVLAMKAVAIARNAHGQREIVRVEGRWYGLGVVVCFVAIGALLVGLRAGGEAVGWGFQLQSPTVVAALAALCFLVALNFLGLVTVGGRLMNVGADAARRDGRVGAFATGTLAVVVATPCTAPFMGAALGYALTRPTPEALAVFAALGIGMALPFLLLTHLPRALGWLPRPGRWMERLKQALAFPMLATTIWLVWVLGAQTDLDTVTTLLAAFVALAFAAWLVKATPGRLGATAATAVVVGAALVVVRAIDSPSLARPAVATGGPLAMTVGAVTWEPYAPGRIEAALAEGRPVLLNVTAAWCVTCLVNERAALASTTVASRLADRRVLALKADWTRRDAAITRLLASFDRGGVPLYVLYPADAAGRAPTVLPQLLTETEVLSALDRLAPTT